VHEVLDAFFKEMQTKGGPAPRNVGVDDVRRLLQIAGRRLDEAKLRGKTGLDIFAEHDARTILSDLAAFLEADNSFRLETGAVPAKFEESIPPVSIGGVEMRGVVDRIDLTPDGRAAWVIDYKTQTAGFEGCRADAPFAGGTKLQPGGAAAAGDIQQVEALLVHLAARRRGIGCSPTPENCSLPRLSAPSSTALPGELGRAQRGERYYRTWENCRWCDFDRSVRCGATRIST
jgi:hypothetical protein